MNTPLLSQDDCGAWVHFSTTRWSKEAAPGIFYPTKNELKTVVTLKQPPGTTAKLVTSLSRDLTFSLND